MTPAFFFGFCVGAACGWGLGCWVAWRVARFVLDVESVEVRRE